MSKTYSTISHKNKSQSKVSYRDYQSYSTEPRDSDSIYYSPELEAELLENSGMMKQEIRRRANRMRKYGQHQY